MQLEIPHENRAADPHCANSALMPIVATFAAAPLGIIVRALDHTVAYTNVALQDMLGFGVLELMRRDAESMIHPDDRAFNRALQRDLMAGRRDAYQVEERYLQRDGQAVWCKVDAWPLRDGEGRLCGSASVLEDIGARKLLEQSNRRTLERYEQILSCTGFAVLGVGTARAVVYANPVAHALFDCAPHQLVGLDFDQVLGASGLTGLARQLHGALDGALQGGLTRHVTWRAALGASGRSVQVECTVAPVVEGARVGGAVLVLRLSRDDGAADCGAAPLAASGEVIASLAKIHHLLAGGVDADDPA